MIEALQSGDLSPMGCALVVAFIALIRRRRPAARSDRD